MCCKYLANPPFQKFKILVKEERRQLITLSKVYSDGLTKAQQENEAPLTFDFVDVNQLEMARPHKIRGKER